MTLRFVAILGAQGSGKSWLAQALTCALQASGHLDNWVISDFPEVTSSSNSEAITLLMGLDLGELGPEQHRQDQRLRHALFNDQTPFRVIYGKGTDRLHNALLALGLPYEANPASPGRESAQFKINQGRDVWQCNECSDPGCEHKLFTGLLAKRAG